MKKFCYLFLGLFAAFSAFGQLNTSGTATGGANKVLSTTGIQIATLSLTDTSGSANPVVLYDTESSSSTNRIVLGYASARVTYTTNIISTYVNSLGVSTSTTNSFLFTTTQTVAPTTNEARRVWTVTVPANGTVLFEPTPAAGTTFGAVLRPVGALTYSMTYNPTP